MVCCGKARVFLYFLREEAAEGLVLRLPLLWPTRWCQPGQYTVLPGERRTILTLECNSEAQITSAEGLCCRSLLANMETTKDQKMGRFMIKKSEDFSPLLLFSLSTPFCLLNFNFTLDD